MNPNKILIADDEQNIRDIIGELLRESGYNTTLAVDGLDALEKARIERFDLYIIDVFMPVMDGIEFLSRLKEIQPLAVVIITTGFSSIDTAIRAIRNGAYHYISKPIQIDELLKVVASGLTHSLALNDIPNVHNPSSDLPNEGQEPQLLRGFTRNQQIDFYALGKTQQYKQGEEIILDDELGTIIWVESGQIAVYYNNALVDNLHSGDLWGEETFFSANVAVDANLRSTDLSVVRHFNKRNIIEFFTIHDETLTKRYMINIVQHSYNKWRRAILRLSLFHGFVPPTHK